MIVTITSLASASQHVKCPRCWKYTHVGLHNYDGLCDACCDVLLVEHPSHPSVPFIRQRRKEFHVEQQGSDQVPVEVGEYSPETTPEYVGNDSGGEWLQKHPGKES
jgi:hypothetical protein